MRTRQLATGEEVRTEEEPVHEAVADEAHLFWRAALRRRSDDLAQTRGQLSGAVEDQSVFQRGEPVRVPHGLTDDPADVRGAIEVELAPDEVLEDRSPVPVFVDEVKPDG